jgi:intracellular septation protein
MPLVTGVVVLVFGGLTLYFQDATFIKMKPTIVNILFGGVLLGGLAFGQSLLKYVFGEVYHLKPAGWLALTWRWGVFFLVLAALNEVVWRNFSDDFWVAFKVWGIMPLTVVFSMLQVPLLTKYADGPDFVTAK